MMSEVDFHNFSSHLCFETYSSMEMENSLKQTSVGQCPRRPPYSGFLFLCVSGSSDISFCCNPSLKDHGPVQELTAKIQGLEQEVTKREAQMQDLELARIEFEKDAKELKQTVSNTIKKLGKQQVECTQPQ